MTSGAVYRVCSKHGRAEIPEERLETIAKAPPTLQNLLRGACDECSAEEKTRQAAESRKHDFLVAMSRANIPERFQNAKLEGFGHDDRSLKIAHHVLRYVENFPQLAQDGVSMVWIGQPGTGKTHLACAAAREIMWRHRVQARYTTALEASKRIKRTYDPSSGESEEKAIGEYVSPGLLIIDEIGIGYGSEAENLHIWEIISRRYNAIAPTILISNLAADQLGALLGDRVMDRMKENGGKVLVFQWDSYRKGGRVNA